VRPRRDALDQPEIGEVPRRDLLDLAVESPPLLDVEGTAREVEE
jgi:hypothetical protein